MKYIDSEKLIAEIEFAKSVYDNPKRVIHGVADAFRQDGRAAMCDDILKKIASLQQEQPEEEMTEWQRFISACLQKNGLLDCGAADRIAKESAAELLKIAKKQINSDGYLIRHRCSFEDEIYHREKRASEKAEAEAKLRWYDKGVEDGKAEALRTRATELTKNLANSGLDKDSIPYHLIEFMCNLYTCKNWKEIEETAEAYSTRLNAAAMKKLPRWVDYTYEIDSPTATLGWLYVGKKKINIRHLEKLPGFDEED